MIGNVEIPVPVDDNGNVCFLAQREIAARYRAIEQCKREISEKCQGILDQKVTL